MKYYSRWMSLSSALFIATLGGTQYAYGIYSGYIKKHFPFSQGEISLIGSFVTFGAYSTLIGGLFFNRFGSRMTIVVAAILSFVGFFLVFLPIDGIIAPSLPLFCFGSYVAQLGNAFLSIACLTNIVRNFPLSHRGRVVGLEKAMIGLSSSFFGEIYMQLFNRNERHFLLFMSVYVPLVLLLCMIPLNLIPPSEIALETEPIFLMVKNETVTTNSQKQAEGETKKKSDDDDEDDYTNNNEEWEKAQLLNHSKEDNEKNEQQQQQDEDEREEEKSQEITRGKLRRDIESRITVFPWLVVLVVFAGFLVLYGCLGEFVDIGLGFRIVGVIGSLSIPLVMFVLPFFYGPVIRESSHHHTDHHHHDHDELAKYLNQTHNDIHHEKQNNNSDGNNNSNSNSNSNDHHTWKTNYTTVETLCSLTFWMMFFIAFVNIGSGFVIINNIAQIVQSLQPTRSSSLQGDLVSSPATPALVHFVSHGASLHVILIGAGAFLGRLTFGYFADHVDRRILRPYVYEFVLCCNFLSVLFNALADFRLLYICVFVEGFFLGSIFSLHAMMMADIFGTHYYASNMGLLDLAASFSSVLLASVVTSFFYHMESYGWDTKQLGVLNRDCFGSKCFGRTLLVCAGLCLIACIVGVFFVKRTLPLYRRLWHIKNQQIDS